MFENLSPNTRLVLRAAAGIAIAIAAGFATLVLLFVGGVTFTGCFIECGDSNALGGSLLLAGSVLAAGLTVSSVVWGFIGWNRRVLTRVALTVAGVAALAVIVVVSASA